MGRLRAMRVGLLAALPLLALVACGSDPQPPEAEASATTPANGDPLAGIPPEELYGASPAESLWSPRIELEITDLPSGWEEAEIAIISDFNLGRWEGNEEVATAAVQRAADAEADLIVLIGDFVSVGSELTALDRVLAPLQGRATIAVLGGADIRSDSLAARINSSLANAGVQVLRNTATAVAMGGDTAWIAGIDPDLASMTAADQEYVLSTLGVPGRTLILLSPSPGMVNRAPDDRFPIAISGGVFCGDVEVPGATTIGNLRENVFPGAVVEGVERLFQVEQTTLLLSCGVGYSFVPLRFGAPPEVPILTLTGGLRAAVSDTTGAVADSIFEPFEPAGADSL